LFDIAKIYKKYDCAKFLENFLGLFLGTIFNLLLKCAYYTDLQDFKCPPGLLGIRYFQGQGPNPHTGNPTFQQILSSDSIFQNVSQTYFVVVLHDEFFSS
jgi:hypothetical protein